MSAFTPGPEETRRARWLPAAAFGAAILGCWEGYVRLLEVNENLLPAPSSVICFMTGEPVLLALHALATLGVTGGGALPGMALGAILGLFLHVRSGARRAVYPWLVASQMIPIAALAPVLVLWFGFNLLPRLAVVALIAFFPVAVATADGLRAADPEMLRLMKSMGASPWKTIRTVSIPAALPHFFSGARLALALSVVGAVFGEWIGARRGLGYLILLYGHRMNTPGVFAAVALLALIGVALFFLAGMAEKTCVPWRRARLKK